MSVKINYLLFLFVIIISTYNMQVLAQKTSGSNISARADLPSDGNTTLGMHENLKPSHVRGARIYDDFTIERGFVPPMDNLLWAAGTPVDPNMPPPTDADKWRCSHCHGFDYEGGVYTYENGATNNLLALKGLTNRDEEFVYNFLSGGLNIADGFGSHINVHNYTGLLDAQNMVDVADFIVNEIYNTREYIRETTNEGRVDHMPSMYIYRGAVDPALDPVPAAIRVDGTNFTCTRCHGLDGRSVPNIDLYAIAWNNPFKWLHRVNFGSPRLLQTYPDISAEDDTIHPGIYEIILTRGLHFGGPEQGSSMLEYTQTHFNP